MKKLRVLALAATIALVAAFSVSAAPRYKAAIGGEFSLGLGNGLPNSALLSFRLPQFPAVFGLGLSIPSSGPSSFALMADWWMYQDRLVEFLNFYVGPGVYLAAGGDSFYAGLRVPVGINAYPIKPLELFLEVAPAMTLIAPSGVSIPSFGLQSGFGFRFWF